MCCGDEEPKPVPLVRIPRPPKIVIRVKGEAGTTAQQLNEGIKVALELIEQGETQGGVFVNNPKGEGPIQVGYFLVGQE